MKIQKQWMLGFEEYFRTPPAFPYTRPKSYRESTLRTSQPLAWPAIAKLWKSTDAPNSDSEMDAKLRALVGGFGCLFLCLSIGGCGAGGSSQAYADEPEYSVQPQSVSALHVPQVEPQRQLRQVIIIGDSLMAGSLQLDDPKAITYRSTTSALLLNDHDLSVHNISLAGQTLLKAVKHKVGNAVNYLTDEGGGNDRTAVVVELAHNDWWYESTLMEIRSNYTALLSQIIQSEAVEVFCMVPVASRWDSTHKLNEHGDSYEDVRNTVRDMASTGLCTLVETRDWFTEADVWDRYIMPDGLHFGGRAHLVYANRLLDAIQ